MSQAPAELLELYDAAIGRLGVEACEPLRAALVQAIERDLPLAQLNLRNGKIGRCVVPPTAAVVAAHRTAPTAPPAPPA